MPTIQPSTLGAKSSGKWKYVLGAAAVLLLLLAVPAARTGYEIYKARTARGSVTHEQRKAAYETAAAAAASTADYPTKPEDLVRDFWKAVSESDTQRALLLAPGTTNKDLAIFDKWKPSPAKSVGPPEPHPSQPDAKLYPVELSFPGVPRKTLKMAVMQEKGSNRYYIHGGYTRWW